MMKQLKLPYLNELDFLPIERWREVLMQKGSFGQIDIVNWNEFPYRPETTFNIAYSHTSLCICYNVKGLGIKALYSKDQEPVWQDSCVEFFCKRVDQEGYSNFEFNCIGTCLSAKHKTRENRVSRTEEEMRKIQRYASVGRNTFDEKDGTFEWYLIVGIPFELLEIDGDNLPEKILANFYKCGDGTKIVHYVSWNAIEVEKPDFHRPDYFGELYF